VIERNRPVVLDCFKIMKEFPATTFSGNYLHTLKTLDLTQNEIADVLCCLIVAKNDCENIALKTFNLNAFWHLMIAITEHSAWCVCV
jgi:hypothetical protein